ncbi:MAG: LysE family translocator [Pseudomonadota bacterium]
MVFLAWLTAIKYNVRIVTINKVRGTVGPGRENKGCNRGETVMMDYGIQGALLGLYAGLSPGPLLTLVISETLERGFRAGLMVALAPIATDTLIITAIIVVLSRIPGTDTVLGALGVLGGCVLCHMGFKSLLARDADVCMDTGSNTGSLKRGILVNLLNPNPYLFWLSIGVPIVLKAWGSGAGDACLFIGGFYTLLVGSKIVLALVVGKYRSFLKGRAYRVVIRGLGLMLIGFAGILLRDGLKLLGFL